MEDFDQCVSVLRVLLAERNPNGIILAETAINELMGATAIPEKRKTLEDLQQIVMAHVNGAPEAQQSFAEAVNSYIEKLIRDLDRP